MSVHAGSILHVGGNNVIDRIQSAGLGDVKLPIDTIREVGNREVVDKVPTEPDFTFTLETLDVSTDVMAWLTGEVGAVASGSAPGASDPAGTEYSWLDCQYVNIPSPWKDEDSGASGAVAGGHIVPGYYPTRMRYRFGTTDNASQEVELAGGSFYYGSFAPVEETAPGDSSDTTFVTANNTIRHRVGGAGGSKFRQVFGVIVGTKLMIEDVDYAVTGGNGSPSTITFTVPPAAGKLVRYTYFTDAPQAYPQAVHASAIIKPGAVRGRNVKVYLGTGGARQKIASIQNLEIEATVDSDVERELGNDEIVGRTINGTDCTGTLTVRSADAPAFMGLLAKVTGIPVTEIYGYYNLNPIPLEVVIENPKTGLPLKTLYVDNAIFQPPGTPAKVNAPTDFEIKFDDQHGTFSEVKGSRA